MPKHNEDDSKLYSVPETSVPQNETFANPESILSGHAMGSEMLAAGSPEDLLDPESHMPEVEEMGPLGLPVVAPSWVFDS